MIYLVKAFDHGDQTQIKKQEVTGIAAAQALELKWEAQGYDVTITMQCTKYIELMKLQNPSALARERAPRRSKTDCRLR